MPIPHSEGSPLFTDALTVLRSPASQSASFDIPYVIWRKGGGLFSTLSSVLGHLRIAETLGCVPVVDFQNFPAYYNELEPINGTRNSWEYYYDPVSALSLVEAYERPLVFLSSGKHPSDTVQSVSQDPSLVETYDKYVRLNAQTSDFVEKSREVMGIGVHTLGVHFRGGEMRRAPSHPYPPTKKQMLKAISEALEFGDFENIFILTEQEDYLDYFARHFGKKLLASDSLRARRRNLYRMSPRENHRFLLGLEVLHDVELLSNCGGLVSGSSNVSEMAILLNRGNYLINLQLRNGTNYSRGLAARSSWYLRAILPAKLGGFDFVKLDAAASHG